MRVLSPAKVNLHLEVGKKRPDGYHEIQTLMLRVDLCDEIEVRRGGRGIRLTGEGESVPEGMDNLACRAAQLFCRETGASEDWEIRLRKRIPVAAGLGGGSGNAAAVLLALNRILGKNLETAFLMDLGSRLGADVPFFLFENPAVGRGKGERLEAVEIPKPLFFLLLVPPFRISTAWAYQAYDLLAAETKATTSLGKSYPRLADLLRILKNDLEIPALSRYPEISRMKEELLRQGARGALMSGSGPVTFGLFPAREEAERAQRALPLPPGWETVIAQGIC